jgi:hypothetical protein
LSIMLESNHWTEYFKERLVDIVMEKSYMDRLTEPALLELQTEVLKSYFKNDNIGGEEGFLKYYQKNIQSIIGSPYRTNLDAVLNIDYVSTKNKKSIKVHKEMSWVCKSNGGAIQDKITWQPEKGEIDKGEVDFVKLEHPTFDLKDGHRVEIYEYNSPKFKEEWKNPDGQGFEMPLKDYIHCDGLKVTISITFFIPVHRFYAWRMAHPSKGCSLTITYPTDLELKIELYGMNDEKKDIKEEAGFYKLSSEKWVLPDEGLVFQLVPATTKKST